MHRPQDCTASSALAGVSLAFPARQYWPLTTEVCFQRVPADDVLPGDIDVHREIAAVIENPLYLLLDTTDGAGVRDLPVQILESEVGSWHPAAILPAHLASLLWCEFSPRLHGHSGGARGSEI